VPYFANTLSDLEFDNYSSETFDFQVLDVDVLDILVVSYVYTHDSADFSTLSFVTEIDKYSFAGD